MGKEGVGGGGGAGEIWSLSAGWGGHKSKPVVMKNSAAPKCSRPIKLLHSFTQNLSIMIKIMVAAPPNFRGGNLKTLDRNNWGDHSWLVMGVIPPFF